MQQKIIDLGKLYHELYVSNTNDAVMSNSAKISPYLFFKWFK